MVKSRQKQRCEHCKAGKVSVYADTLERALFCHVCGLPPLYKISGDSRRCSPLRYVYYLVGTPRLRGQWEIGRNRPGAAGRPKPSGAPQKAPQSLLEPGAFGVSWHLGSSGFDAGGHLVRGTLDGSWRLYHGMLFRKKRFRRKRMDSDSQKELGIESDQWRELMQEDPDAFLDAALEDPALMKRLFPDRWRELIGDDPGDSIENARQDPGDIIESMDPEDLKVQFPDIWLKRYGKKQAIEDDSDIDNRADIEADSR